MKKTTFLKLSLSLSSKKTVVYLLLSACVLSALFFKLGDFGLWEPGETEKAETAFNIAEGKNTFQYPFYNHLL